MVIGHKPFVEKLALRIRRAGVILWNCVPHEQAKKVFEALSRIGMKSYAQDEEAGITSGSFVDFFEVRPSLKSIGNIDGFFCWGSHDFSFVQEYFLFEKPETAEKVALTGGLRSAFWGELGRQYFAKDISEFNKRLGPYVVFATNFATSKPFLSHRAYERFSKLQMNHQTWEYENSVTRARDDLNISLFHEAIDRTLEETEYCVVWRPHPAEDKKYFSKIFGTHPRFVTTAGGDASPLLLGARSVVHHGSTVALQAFSTGPSVISLGDHSGQRPQGGGIPEVISTCVSNVDELLQELLSGKADVSSRTVDKSLVRSRVAFRGQPTSVHKILDIIDRSVGDAEPESIHVSSNLWARAFISGASYRLLRHLPSMVLPRRVNVAIQKRRVLDKSMTREYLKRAKQTLGREVGFSIKSYWGVAAIIRAEPRGN